MYFRSNGDIRVAPDEANPIVLIRSGEEGLGRYEGGLSVLNSELDATVLTLSALSTRGNVRSLSLVSDQPITENSRFEGGMFESSVDIPVPRRCEHVDNEGQVRAFAAAIEGVQLGFGLLRSGHVSCKKTCIRIRGLESVDRVPTMLVRWSDLGIADSGFKLINPDPRMRCGAASRRSFGPKSMEELRDVLLEKSRTTDLEGFKIISY